MTYPHAHKGVVKIFLGALFEVLASILVFAAAILLALPESANANSVTALTAAYLTIGGGFLAILAFIFQLIGLFQAKPDEKNFANALWAIFLNIVLVLARIALGFIQQPWASTTVSVLNSVDSALSCVVICYILTAISNLTLNLNEKGFSVRGRLIRGILVVLFLLSFAMNMMSTFIRPNEEVARVMGIISIIAAGAELLAHIWYFFYLGRACKKLKK